jgi:hypothetical protein
MLTLEQYKQCCFPQEWVNNSVIAYLNGQGYNIKYKVGNYYVDP